MAANKRVLFLGAAGLIGPHLIPGLADDYDLRLADVKSHPDGIDVDHVDVTDYEQVALQLGVVDLASDLGAGDRADFWRRAASSRLSGVKAEGKS